MPGKRRKVSKPSSSHGNLDPFTTFSKPTFSLNEVKQHATTSCPQAAVIERGKRKLPIEEKLSTPTQETSKSRVIRPLPRTRRSLLTTPPKPVSPPTPSSDTPTSKAANLLNRVNLTKSSPAQWDSSPVRQDSSVFDGSDRPISSQSSVNPPLLEAHEQVPAELMDLVNLHASFLNALSLHYAHNGTHTPADLRNLLPSIALNWGKRSVKLVDVQRGLGVQNLHTESTSLRSSDITLVNYGNGAICIETGAVFGRKGVMARPINEQLLLTQYTANLILLWKKHSQTAVASEEPEPESILKFIDSLPQQSIPTNASLDNTSPTLTKGARRLADIKASHALKNSRNATFKKNQTFLTPPSKASGSTSAKASPLSRKSSLLERIRAKSAAAALLPPPPSQSERLRISALHRLPELIGILTVMSTAGNAGQSRVSFSMGTVLGKLKDSCRGEIGTDEGRMCLEILGGDVGCGWVKVIGGSGGKGGAVVIDRERRPEESVVGEKIKLALASAGGEGMNHDDGLR